GCPSNGSYWRSAGERMSLRWLKKSRPPVRLSTSRWLAVVTASTLAVVVPRMRHTSSLFLSSANVCNGLDGANGFVGYTPLTGRRSTKLGVVGYTRKVLVPVLSLFDIPRFARL